MSFRARILSEIHFISGSMNSPWLETWRVEFYVNWNMVLATATNEYTKGWIYFGAVFLVAARVERRFVWLEFMGKIR